MSVRSNPGFARVLKRYRSAVEDKAFDGTIPWDCAEAIEAHAAIDAEMEAATEALCNWIDKRLPNG